MWTVYNGKTCVMVWDNNKHNWIYIPERKWYSMDPKSRQKYIEWYINFTCA